MGFFDKEGIEKIGERAIELMRKNVLLKIAGKLPNYNEFKIYSRVDGKQKIIEGCLHFNVAQTITAKMMNTDDFSFIEKKFILPMIEYLSEKLNDNGDYDKYLLIPLQVPGEYNGLYYTKYNSIMGIRLIKSYNIKTCSSELHMDIALIKEKEYFKIINTKGN